MQPLFRMAIHLKHYGDDGLSFLQRERNLVHDVGRVDGGRGEDRQHARAVGESIFDRAIPPLARSDVQLIQPDVCSRRFQVCGELNDKTGIGPAVAEKRCKFVERQSQSPPERTLSKEFLVNIARE